MGLFLVSAEAMCMAFEQAGGEGVAALPLPVPGTA